MAAKKPPKAPPVRVIGAKKAWFGDLYHVFLRLSWSAALAVIIVFYLTLNALFASAYFAIGGVENARDGYFDSFFFSIQTMGTIGYGNMYPTTRLANALVVCESVTGLMITALVTGLVFSKFSQSQARVVFTERIGIAPMDGVPTLTFRVGNQRSSQIVEARLRVVLMRTERTLEGMVFYRMHDLKLSRDRSPAMSRSFTVLHPIDRASPLFGETPTTLKQKEVEILVTVVGTDDTSLQPVHARHTYPDDAIVFGARPVDILSEAPDGTLVVDLTKFHQLEATKPTGEFPWPAA